MRRVTLPAVPARILVVDDDEVTMQFTAWVLERSGHAVLRARDGQEGLAVALRELPDLILSDMRMAGMGGEALGRALQADHRLARTPRVAVTGHAAPGAEEEVLAHGFHGYIAKPIEVDTFVRQVEAYLPAELRTSHEMTDP